MARARCEVEAVLLEFLAARGIGKEERLAVGFSGGPDSTALLAALCALGWESPVAVHVDHGIRNRVELDAERALVRGLCASLGATLLVASVRPGAVLERARSRGEGIEAEARRYRYAALSSSLRRSSAKALLLAHTRDDQVETLLMRLLGGSGTGGLRGIPVARGPFLRPFLGLEKAKLLEYLESRGLPFSMDSSNASGDFLRNRIRRDLLPLLDSDFPGWRKGLARSAAKAILDEEALSAAADALEFALPDSGSAELSLPEKALLEAPTAVALRAIQRAQARLLGKERLPSGMTAAALKAIRGGDAAAYRGAGLELFRRDGRVILRHGLDFPRRGGYFVLIDRPIRVRVGSLAVSAAWDSGGRSGIRADAFSFTLVVRSRRPGDAIALRSGTKRLDAIFSDWALSESSRCAAPVIEDRDGIVAVLGAAFGGRDRYRAGPVGECAHRLSINVKGA
jgi:tRNA(Ile)-lysidine synthetase-like protein